jgi:hypothetical protein
MGQMEIVQALDIQIASTLDYALEFINSFLTGE